MSKFLCFRDIANFVFRSNCKVQHDMFHIIQNRQIHVTGLVQDVKRNWQQNPTELNSESQQQERNNDNKKIKPPSLRDLWKSDEDLSSKQKRRKKPKLGENITEQKNNPRRDKNSAYRTTGVTMDSEAVNQVRNGDITQQGNRFSYNSYLSTGSRRVIINDEKRDQEDCNFKPFSLPHYSDNTLTDTEGQRQWNMTGQYYRDKEENPFEEGYLDLNENRQSYRDAQFQWTKQLESFKRNMENPEKKKKRKSN